MDYKPTRKQTFAITELMLMTNVELHWYQNAKRKENTKLKFIKKNIFKYIKNDIT